MFFWRYYDMAPKKKMVCGEEAVVNGTHGAMRVKCQLEKGHRGSHKETGFHRNKKNVWSVYWRSKK